MNPSPVIEFFTPYAQQIADAATQAIIAAIGLASLAFAGWFRNKMQLKAAVDATVEVEQRSAADEAAGYAKTPGVAKKSIAVQATLAALPMLARPVTRAGAGRLVEKAAKPLTQAGIAPEQKP